MSRARVRRTAAAVVIPELCKVITPPAGGHFTLSYDRRHVLPYRRLDLIGRRWECRSNTRIRVFRRTRYT